MSESIENLIDTLIAAYDNQQMSQGRARTSTDRITGIERQIKDVFDILRQYTAKERYDVVKNVPQEEENQQEIEDERETNPQYESQQLNPEVNMIIASIEKHLKNPNNLKPRDRQSFASYINLAKYYSHFSEQDLRTCIKRLKLIDCVCKYGWPEEDDSSEEDTNSESQSEGDYQEQKINRGRGMGRRMRRGMGIGMRRGMGRGMRRGMGGGMRRGRGIGMRGYNRIGTPIRHTQEEKVEVKQLEETQPTSSDDELSSFYHQYIRKKDNTDTEYIMYFN